jgi:DEAD/DEAH box helicase
MMDPVEHWDAGPDQVERFGVEVVEDDAFDDLVGYRTAGGSLADARRAGDDAVEGLDKITAQMTGGEHRPEQEEMCRAIAEALATGTHLVVQAGTGTGKSLAYLVPSALSGKKVVVATATKALPRPGPASLGGGGDRA